MSQDKINSINNTVVTYSGDKTQRLMMAGWHEIGTKDYSRWYHPNVFGAHTIQGAIKVMEDNQDLSFWGNPSPIKEMLSPDFLTKGR